MLPELATAGKVWAAFNGAKDTAEAALIARDLYRGQQDDGVIEFLKHIAAIVGDQRQLFSSPFLQTDEGKEFWKKIVGCAADGQLAEKRQLFAFTFYNGVRAGKLPQLKRLKHADLLRSLSKASLMMLAEIDKELRSKFEALPLPKNGALPVNSPKMEWGADESPFYADALMRELKFSGVFSPIHRFTETAEGRQAPAHTVIPEHVGYNLFTWEFCRIISLPETKDPFDPLLR